MPTARRACARRDGPYPFVTCCCTSLGFGYSFFNHDLRRYREATRRDTAPDAAPDPHAHIRGPLLFDPGDRWEYGTGIDWAGRIVEAVRGQLLGDTFRDHLLGPLGMDDTRYALTRSMYGRLATMHRRYPSGEVVAERGWLDHAPEDDVPPEPEVTHGGGGLFTTALDYARFLRMILAGRDSPGGRVLRPETVDLMASDGIGPLRSGGWQAADRLLTNAGEFLPGTPKGWGLTFQIAREDVPGGRCAGSLAWAGLGNLYFWIDRATRLAIGAWASGADPSRVRQDARSDVRKWLVAVAGGCCVVARNADTMVRRRDRDERTRGHPRDARLHQGPRPCRGDGKRPVHRRTFVAPRYPAAPALPALLSRA